MSVDRGALMVLQTDPWWCRQRPGGADRLEMLETNSAHSSVISCFCPSSFLCVADHQEVLYINTEQITGPIWLFTTARLNI